LVLEGSGNTLTTGVDPRVLVFTFAVSLVTALAFGLVPAFGTSQVESFVALKAGGRQVPSGGGRFGARAVLVAAQVAISIVLLVGAGLFLRTLMNLKQLDPGFEREAVLAVRLEPRGSNQKRQNGLRLMQLYGGLVERLRYVPGVRSASLAGATPLGNEFGLTLDAIAPRYEPPREGDGKLRLMQVYPAYFSTLGIPVLAGRELLPRDNDPGMITDPSGFRVVVINETAARTFFGRVDRVVGERLTIRGAPCEVVGVVKDTHERGLRESVQPTGYASYAQAPTGRGQMTLLVRGSGDLQGLAATIQRLARETDPAMPLREVQTLAARVDAVTRQERLLALLSSVFGVLALVIAAIGLYGVLAYTVTRRHAEFGVRLALGASPGGLERMILLESFGMVGAGLCVGLAIAAFAARGLSHLLFDLRAIDPVSFAAAGGILLGIAAVAAYLPARQAARVDPVKALRVE
jgi:predicted permease